MKEKRIMVQVRSIKEAIEEIEKDHDVELIGDMEEDDRI